MILCFEPEKFWIIFCFETDNFLSLTEQARFQKKHTDIHRFCSKKVGDFPETNFIRFLQEIRKITVFSAIQ